MTENPFTKLKRLQKEKEEYSMITLGDETVQNLLREQEDPLTLQKS